MKNFIKDKLCLFSSAFAVLFFVLIIGSISKFQDNFFSIIIYFVLMVFFGFLAKKSNPMPELHIAAAGADLKKLESIIAKGVDINIKDPYGQTALFPVLAVDKEPNEKIDFINRMISSGADINSTINLTGIPFSVLDVSIEYNNDPKVITLIRKQGGKHASIWGAAAGGDIKSVGKFLFNGANVSGTNVDKTTPLHFASHYGNKETAELLINKGADVNAKDIDNKSPLDFAIKGNQLETADLLRKHGGKTSEELKAEEINK